MILPCGFLPEMKLTSFVPSKLTFSEYLRCLNFPLWILWPAIAKQVKESDLSTAPTSSGKFKHLRFSENVNFEGTNSADSILESTFLEEIGDVCMWNSESVTAANKMMRLWSVIQTHKHSVRQTYTKFEIVI